MSIIIRLQNLPWSANSVDIRRFFSGQSIPEGGVHIVGGEMGDAFIAFSTDEDARLAMAKDGGKIKDMQIKLLLSSRTEMMRVIEQARQQNVVVTQPHIVSTQPAILTLQQPSRIPQSSEPERRRGRSPSPPRRSRDRSPTRDRRRSPDDRRGSKRDRSRSPSRSSRSFSRDSRDTDRRSDRFRQEKRDDRRYDDSRYRDDRRSARDPPQESKKYLDADNVNSRSQLHATEGFRDMQPVYDQPPNVSISSVYPYGTQQPHPVKNFSNTYGHPPSESSAPFSQAGRIPPLQKSVETLPLVESKHSSSSSIYPHEQMSFRAAPFEPPTATTKESSMPPPIQQQMSKLRRHSRFEPGFEPSSTEPHFRAPDPAAIVPKAENQREPLTYNTGRPRENYPEDRNIWPHDVAERSENVSWNEIRQPLLEPPISKNSDFQQVVPMDLDPPPSDATPEKEIYAENLPPRGPNPYIRNNGSPRNDDFRRDNQNRGSPMRNDRQEHVPQSLTIEVRGLPPDARIDDVLEIFRGIPLPAANIRIQASDQGFEKAFIRFISIEDFEEALSRNRRLAHEGRCELVPCPAVAFDSASRQQRHKPKPKPRDEDLTIQLRGLPFSCKDEDIIHFFDGLVILDLFVEYDVDGRATGTGFVEFGSVEDFHSALAINGKRIGHRYITISVASKEMMAFQRGEEYIPRDSCSNDNRPLNPPINQVRPPPPSNHNRPPINQNRPPPPPNQGRPPPPSNQGRTSPPNQGRPPPPNQGRPPPPTQGRPPPPNQGRPPPPNQGRPPPPPCISMKGLPEGVTNGNIADFLGEVHVMPRAIHIMLRPDKTPSGDAYAEFAGLADMDAALQMDGKNMLGNCVSIQPITFHEMSEILGRPAPPIPPPPVPGALLRTPNDAERPRRPLLSQGPGEALYRERPHMEQLIRGGRPRMEPFKKNIDGPPGRPPFGPSRIRAPWSNRDNRFPSPSPDRHVKDFGSPGSVVSINNLHFRAGVEELLDFFQEYNISKGSVFRKYENGKATGEARVAFQNPGDAERAVAELNRKPIMGRALLLSIL